MDDAHPQLECGTQPFCHRIWRPDAPANVRFNELEQRQLLYRRGRELGLAARPRLVLFCCQTGRKPNQPKPKQKTIYTVIFTKPDAVRKHATTSTSHRTILLIACVSAFISHPSVSGEDAELHSLIVLSNHALPHISQTLMELSGQHCLNSMTVVAVLSVRQNRRCYDRFL